MASAYERRNARARAAGWSSYGEQRRAKELGYQAPRTYRDAKTAAKRAGHATEPNRWEPMRTRGDTTTADAGGGRRGIAGPWYDLPNVAAELGRFRRDDRRATFYVGGKTVGRSKGFTLGFVRDRIAEHGSLEAWLETMLSVTASDSEGATSGDDVSVTVGS